MYMDRQLRNHEIRQHEEESQAMDDEKTRVFSTTVASMFIMDVLNEGHNAADKAMQKMMCRHNLENLEPPTVHSAWKASWGSQILCNLCSRPGITDCTICRKCNIITHNQCIAESGKSVSNYDCPSCLDSIKTENMYYGKFLDRLEHERKIDRSARRIAKRLVEMVARKRLIKRRKSVIKMQSIARMFICRKKYVKWLRAQMKILIINVTHLPAAVIENGVVVLTVFDTLKNVQAFRLDATAKDALKQGFLIPGLGAIMTILLTLAHREETSESR